ncbi:hypothetical protein [Terrabacter sp. BE26]|uniref:hypothetical protein n=1 Tax=Terrabacter sp. BE26 TaxID=2898152 RepID=UPI0035BE9B3B
MTAQTPARVLRGERRPEAKVELVNRILGVLGADEDTVVETSRQLLSVSYAGERGTLRWTGRPATPLSDVALLTNAAGEPGIGHEVRAELPSADRVDVVMAFVKWHGIRVNESQLRELRERRVPFRIITTTYLGATERAALGRLVEEFGAEARVQYDALRTRLHAKAWLLPAQHRVRHRLRRVQQPLACRPARRGRVERAALGRRHPDPHREVPGHVRQLLARCDVRGLRPRP